MDSSRRAQNSVPVAESPGGAKLHLVEQGPQTLKTSLILLMQNL